MSDRLCVSIAASSTNRLSAPSCAAEWSKPHRSSAAVWTLGIRVRIAFVNHRDSEDLLVGIAASFAYLRALAAKPGRPTTLLGGGARRCEII